MTRLAALAIACLAALAPSAQALEAVAEFGATDPAAPRFVIHGSADIERFAPILDAFAARMPALRIVYEQRTTNDIYARAAAACAAGEASAHLLVSSSIDQQVRLVNDGCAEPHRSRVTDAAPAWARWRDEVFGLTREPAVMVYNRTLVPAAEVPRSRFDLIDLLRPAENRYTGRIATYDVERSGLGYLFAFADSQQATTFGRLIEAFGRNRVAVAASSAALIEGVASGDYLVAYNILGSYALARAEEDPRLGVVAPADYTLLLTRAALIPRGAGQPAAARAFIDFALGKAGQALLAEALLIVDAADPRLGTGASGTALRPIALSPVLLVGLDRQKRRIFLETWRAGIYAPD
ncbi:MAG: ABC transporter substrate-binding protein [Pseudomonadota bacterium]